MSDDVTDYGEPDVTIESLLEVPAFAKAGRKERNYNADEVDSYLDKLIPMCRELKEALTNAQHAFSEKVKQYDEVSQNYNDLSLHIDSGGVYNAKDATQKLPSSDPAIVDDGEWADTIADDKKKEVEYQARIKQLTEELEQEKAKSRTLQGRTSLPVRKQESPVGMTSDDLWDVDSNNLAINKDSDENSAPAFHEPEGVDPDPMPNPDPMPEPEPVQSVPPARESNGKTSLGDDYSFASDTEHASAIVAHAARIGLVSIEEATAKAEAIKLAAVEEAEAMRTEEVEKFENAKAMLAEVVSSLNGIYTAHLEEAHNIQDYISENNLSESNSPEKASAINENPSWDELGLN